MKITSNELAKHKATGGFLGRNTTRNNTFLPKVMSGLLAIAIFVSLFQQEPASTSTGAYIVEETIPEPSEEWLLAVHSPQTTHDPSQTNETKEAFLARQPRYLKLVRIRIQTKAVVVASIRKTLPFWNPFHAPTDQQEAKPSHEWKQEVTVEEPFRVHAATVDWEKPPMFLVAHDQGNIAIVQPCNLLSCVSYIPLKEEKENHHPQKLVELPGQAYSVHVNGTSVFLGLATSVGWVDFAVDKPKYTELFHRELDYQGFDLSLSPKKYDMLVRKDDLLLAVDDVASPYYADTFRVDANGKNPVHKESLDLPPVVYGHYFLATMLQDDQLVLANTWSGMSGSGQALVRRPLQAFCRPTIPYQRDRPCQNNVPDHYGGKGGAEWGEVTYFGYASSGDYDANWKGWKPRPEEVTEWQGIAVRQDNEGADKDLLMAVGKRGLMTLPVDFDALTIPAFASFGGPVYAVQTRGSDAWVLVNPIGADGGSTLVNVETRKEFTLPGYEDPWFAAREKKKKKKVLGYYNNLL